MNITFIKDEINNLGSIKSNRLYPIANEIIEKKWPKNDDSYDQFKFLIECNSFLKVYLLLGIILVTSYK